MSSNPQKPQIVPLPNGPYYLLTDFIPKPVQHLQSSTGEPLASIRGAALCRCGGSSNKPFCDGTHGTNGFSDKRLNDGSADKRDNYAGARLTIHDNRGICAHAGRCTDGLPAVFKLATEPWIDPDGATVEAILDTVKKCPSGALSYSIDGVEHRDQDREPMVTVTKNGPYALTGGVEVAVADRAEGASTEHCTMCRCGGSKNKPFCDGTHWHIGFQDEKN